MGEKQAVGALPPVTCCLSSTPAEHSVLGALVTQMQDMAGSPSRLCKQRKGTALSVTEPGYRQQTQGVGRPGQYWKVPAGLGGGMGSTQKLRAFLFSLTLYLEVARAITQEL